MIRYLISLKSGITYIFSHYHTKIEVYSYNSLVIKKTLTLHNVIILIKSVLNKDQNLYDMIFSKKCLYRLARKSSQFFFDSLILRFGETKITKEKFYASRKPLRIWNVNIHSMSQN